MSSRTSWSCFALLASALGAAQVQACNVLDHAIADTTKAMVGQYDQAGKFQKEIPKAEVIGLKVGACNEELGLVKITKADGSSIWLDLIEIKVPTALPADDSDVCVVKNNSQDPSTKQVVSSGAGPGRKSCPPEK